VKQAWLTTSWDDGHPHDFRVAELLTKYGLTGTFYIPKICDQGTMSPAHVRDLASSFEIGAHTLNHVFLTEVDDDTAEQEIAGSRKWVEDTTGKQCTMFCPPAGKYHPRHLRMIAAAGFIGFRSVEFLSLDPPRRQRADGLLEMPTTLQARHHSELAYLKNFAKRRAARNLWLYLLHAQSPLWPDKARSLLETTLRKGGVFHLWGHSWEIHQQHQWDRLEYVLKMMGEVTEEAPCLSNGELCRRALTPNSTTPRASVASATNAC
jgi:hypothetical protein